MTLVSVNRTKHEILYLMMEAMGQRGEHITKIVYRSYVSYNQCKKHLAYLIEKGFVTYENELYRVTAKGEHFMTIYRVLRKELGEE